MSGKLANRRFGPVSFALALVFLGAVDSASAQLSQRLRKADLEALQTAFVHLAKDVRPSVVAIRTYVRHSGEWHGEGVRIPYSQGSGFVIGADGYVATNFHVIDGADDVTVITHTGRKLDATVQQFDVRTDLAVLRVDADDLTPVRFGDLSEVQINQWVFAYGNPFGLANDDGVSAITYGVVSALGREMTERLNANPRLQYYGNLIQTSAAINPGNSGGPLFDIDGRLIGVVTAIETGSGVSEGAGFAIPIDKNTRRVLELLRQGRRVRYGYMGVQINDVRQPSSQRVAVTRKGRGARIVGVETGGPAAKAGLRPEDIVISIDNEDIQDYDHLLRLVQYSPVGAKIRITYLRDGVKRRTIVTLADREQLLGLADRQ